MRPEQPVQRMERLLNTSAIGSKRVVIDEVQRVEQLGACWIVVSHRSVDCKGYLYMTRQRKNISGHRLAYRLWWAKDIPKGLDCSHLCETEKDTLSRRCINPYHMVLEDRSHNLLRSKRVGRYSREEKGIKKYTN